MYDHVGGPSYPIHAYQSDQPSQGKNGRKNNIAIDEVTSYQRSVMPRASRFPSTSSALLSASRSSPGTGRRTPCHGKPPKPGIGRARSGTLTVCTLSPRSPSIYRRRGNIWSGDTGCTHREGGGLAERSSAPRIAQAIRAGSASRKTRAPERWYGRAQILAGEPASVEVDTGAGEAIEVGNASRKKAAPSVHRLAMARLLAKVYEVDPFLCPNCGGKIAVIAVIQDPEEIRGIIACRAQKAREPP